MLIITVLKKSNLHVSTFCWKYRGIPLKFQNLQAANMLVPKTKLVRLWISEVPLTKKATILIQKYSVSNDDLLLKWNRRLYVILCLLILNNRYRISFFSPPWLFHSIYDTSL